MSHEIQNNARFHKIIFILGMALRYGDQLKITLTPPTFTTMTRMHEKQDDLLNVIVGREVNEFVKRHIPPRYVRKEPCMPSWVRGYNEKSWEQWANGLITWHEFINEWVVKYHDSNAASLAEFDETDPNNWFI